MTRCQVADSRQGFHRKHSAKMFHVKHLCLLFAGKGFTVDFGTRSFGGVRESSLATLQPIRARRSGQSHFARIKVLNFV